jgi:SAM-dependent methyltransferase
MVQFSEHAQQLIALRYRFPPKATPGTLSSVGEWWQEFFRGLWQQAQLGWWSQDDTRAAADKVERALGLSSPAKVLDVPCGDGRISIELAARGHDVTGVDLNETFLAEAGRKAGDRGLSARWVQGDMRELPFESEFEAALNFWGSFGYFDEGGNERTAASVWRALTPGGRFLIDLPTAETVFPHFRGRFWFGSDQALVLDETRYDFETGRNESDWTVITPDGSREHLHSSIRLYTYRELVELLRKVGFTRFEGFDGKDLAPFQLGARLCLVATK